MCLHIWTTIQVRFVVQYVEIPSKLGNILPVGFGKDVDDKLAEDHGAEWVGKEGKKDGFVSILTHMVSILLEGRPPLYGGWWHTTTTKSLGTRTVRPGKVGQSARLAIGISCTRVMKKKKKRKKKRQSAQSVQ